jgi:hypothetical protein
VPVEEEDGRPASASPDAEYGLPDVDELELESIEHGAINARTSAAERGNLRPCAAGERGFSPAR